MSDPLIIVAVMIDEPSAGKYYGGQIAGPVFSRIAGDALHALAVEPDAPFETMIGPATPPAGVAPAGPAAGKAAARGAKPPARGRV